MSKKARTPKNKNKAKPEFDFKNRIPVDDPKRAEEVARRIHALRTEHPSREKLEAFARIQPLGPLEIEAIAEHLRGNCEGCLHIVEEARKGAKSTQSPSR